MSGSIRQSLNYRAFCCLLTRQIMKEPITASDGFIYEQEALFKYTESHGLISPSTGEVLKKGWRKNPIFKQLISKFLAEHPELRQDQYRPKVLTPVVVPVPREPQGERQVRKLPFAVTFFNPPISDPITDPVSLREFIIFSRRSAVLTPQNSESLDSNKWESDKWATLRGVIEYLLSVI